MVDRKGMNVFSLAHPGLFVKVVQTGSSGNCVPGQLKKDMRADRKTA